MTPGLKDQEFRELLWVKEFESTISNLMTIDLKLSKNSSTRY